MRALPSVVTFAIMLIGITVPSYWRDEAATLAAIRRPFGDMLRMLGNVDAVHGLYYMIIWVVARLFGTGELALRLPSAVAMAVAAGFVAALGRRLGSPRVGLAAGLLFAVVPDISFYGQDARSYAMVTAMAAVASYLLVRALDAAPGGRRRWWIGYAVALALLGILNIFGLLLIGAHAVTMLARCRHPVPGDSRRRLLLGWAVAACAAIVVCGPMLVLGWLQRGQIGWLAAAGEDKLGSVTRLVGTWQMASVAAGVVALGILVTGWRHRERLGPAWLGPLPAIALPWLIVPPAVLLLGSLVYPEYTFRYILFCVPAAALLGGAGVAALGRVAGTVALIVVAVLGLGMQSSFRTPDGHGDNIREADRQIALNARPGDVVLYTNPNAESFGAAYPYGLGRLRNIELAEPAIRSGTLAGTNVSTAVLRQRLRHVSRLWVVEIDKRASAWPILHGLRFDPVWTIQTGEDWLRLYIREGSAAWREPLHSRTR
jgi:mannosyltransferase